jgi:hypothetical protein
MQMECYAACMRQVVSVGAGRCRKMQHRSGREVQKDAAQKLGQGGAERCSTEVFLKYCTSCVCMWGQGRDAAQKLKKLIAAVVVAPACIAVVSTAEWDTPYNSIWLQGPIIHEINGNCIMRNPFIPSPDV